MLIAAYGPTLQLPAGISQHSVADWRRDRVAELDRQSLAATPFRTLLAEELRGAWQTARALRARMASERADTAAAPCRGVSEAA